VTKGAFLEDPAEHMSVHVENCLSGIFAGIENQSELAVPMFVGKLLAYGNNLSQERRIPCG
jgi:hypothetical protein